MTWNQSSFSKFDDYTFTANIQIDGSGKDDWMNTNDPGLVKNECHLGYGADITFIAGERILLHPGFWAKSGSHFTAKIDSKLLDNVIIDSTKNNKKDQVTYGNIELKHSNNSNIIMTDIEKSNLVLLKNEFKNQLIIYPNPNPGKFNIELFEKGVAVYSIEIVNTIGKTVYKKQNIPTGKTEIDISNQTKGVYFVKIRVGDKLFTEKVICR